MRANIVWSAWKPFECGYLGDKVPPREESWLWIHFWAVGSLLSSVCLGPKSTSMPEYGSDGLSSSTEPDLYTPAVLQQSCSRFESMVYCLCKLPPHTA
jgi:hypothetical protein